MIYLALPYHYLTSPRIPVKATGQVSLKSFRGLGRAVLCKNFFKTQLFSVINHTAWGAKKMPMVSLKAEGWIHLSSGSRSSSRPQEWVRFASTPCPSKEGFEELLWGTQGRTHVYTQFSNSELQITSVGASQCCLWSHTGVLWFLPTSPAISHSRMGSCVERSNEIHSVLFTNCFQPCGERYF